MQLTSDKVTVPAQQKDVIHFLRDCRNLVHLLPQDQISDFKASETDCSFKVQGGITISLVKEEKEESDKLFMRSGEKSPFPFQLIIHTLDQGSATEGHIEFQGEVNVFIKMMVEKPLSALFNIMSGKLRDHFSQK
jgi:carbon monoxide dehydrogenase subunit G